MHCNDLVKALVTKGTWADADEYFKMKCDVRFNKQTKNENLYFEITRQFHD